MIALASKKRYISLYVACADEGVYVAERFAQRLPGADVGKSCVRFTRLKDVDLEILRELLEEAVRVGPVGAVAG